MMDEDIDDLLDEVEDKFVKRNKKSTPTPKPTIQNTTQQKQTKSKHKDDDINAMIDDIIDDDGIDLENAKKPLGKTNSDSGSVSGSKTKRCLTLFIGGSNCEQGLSTAVKSRCCDSLRCTDCDFAVSSFDNYQWHSSTDYLFLRNNIPDFHRLQPKLKPKKGSRAYACQCKSRSVTEMTNLQKDLDLKWFCGKH